MRKKLLLLAFLTLSLCEALVAQSVPFPTPDPPPNVISPWGYQQVGTSWDTSPFLPFIYQGVWFRMLLPNGVTYNRTTNTFTYADPTKKYPMIVFNHGAGETGTNNNLQLIHGGQIHRDAVRNNVFPGFCLYPQTISGVLSPTWFSNIVNKLANENHVDIDRIYTHGLSRGATTTWFMVDENPKLVAAAFPMSSGASNFDLDVAEIPVRLAQGGKDTNPNPTYTQSTVDRYNNAGANLEYFYFPNLGHNTWNTCYVMPDFFSWFLAQKKNKIHVFFKNTEVCPGSPINIKLGFTGGFDGYEWRKDGVLIAGATGHNYTATAYGVYTGRFRRGAVWTEWSDPVEIKIKGATVTPPIQVDGLASKVLPAPDGATTVPLELPAGYATYTWKQVGSETVIGTIQRKTVGVGQYIAQVTEVGGCSAVYSPVFTVVNANGANGPDPISNLRLRAVGKTSVELAWDNTAAPAQNETGFEIYRSLFSGGPYQLVKINPADNLLYLDQNLISGTVYHYIIRPVNENAAAATNAPVSIKTGVDEVAPSAPTNLTRGTTTPTSVALSWGAATDDSGTVTYDIFVNGFRSNTTSSLSAVVNGLSQGTLYNFVVKAKDGAGNLSEPSNQISTALVMTGLDYKYYQGNWTMLPNFDALTPVAVGWVSNFSLTPRLQNDFFGFKFTGKLNVTTAGDYTFYLSSDDGSKLYIDGVLRVNNDGLHGTGDVAGAPFALTQGVHDIRVDQFEQAGGEGLTVRWSRPGLNTQNIPTANLTDVFVYPAVPPTPTALTLTATSYQSINVAWAFSGTATSFEIQRSLTGSGSSWVNVAIVPGALRSFLNTGLNPNTRYYYRIRAIGANGESGYTGSQNKFTLVLPAVPAAPTNLASANITTSTLDLTWTDNSDNEDGFDVFRSINANDAYSQVATVTTTTYADAALLPHTTYFYKVRAKNAGGPSVAYSNEISVTTLNASPTLTAIVDTIAMRFDETKVITLSSTDADLDAIFIEGAAGNPAFSNLFDYGEGMAELFLEPTAANVGSHDLEFTAIDAFGGASAVLKLHVVINNNHSPVIQPFTDLTTKESIRVKRTFKATDIDAGDHITWTFNNLPAFITKTTAGDSVTLTIEPQTNDAGVYDIEFSAADSQGSQDVKVWHLTVSDYDPNFKVYVSLGTVTVAPAPWNNFKTAGTVATAGLASADLLNQSAQNTGISILLNTTWETSSGANGVTPGIYPNPVMLSNFVSTKANGAEILTIRGLAPNHKYSFDFFGSRNSNPNRTTIIEINGVQVSYEAAMNTSNVARFTNIVPSANGEIQVRVTAGAAAQFAYLNSIIIESLYDGTAPPAAPTDLLAGYAVTGPVDVVLDWTDNSSTETGFEVFKSTEGGAFSKIATTLPNVATYKDVNTTPYVNYEYTVRGVNTNGASAFSDTVSIVGANNPPIISPISVISVGAGQTRTVQMIATDADGGLLTFGLDAAPGFVSLADVSNGVANLTIAPTAGDVGNYFFNVMVFDDQGDLDFKEITIVVSDFQESFVYVNFSPPTATVPAPWNNTNFSPNGSNTVTASNLKDNFNTTTTISVSLPSWGSAGANTGAQAGGLGVYPDAVIRTAVTHGNGTSGVVRTVVVGGLRADYLYDFDFLASRENQPNRTTVFSSGAQSQSVNVNNNISQLAKLVGLKPDGAGNITVNVTTGNGGFAYMSSMVVREYTDLGKPNAPINLDAQVVTRNSAKLKWTDLSDNETGFEIYRSSPRNLDYQLVATTAANAVTFTDATLVQNTTYFYKIRAKKDATTFSSYSNESNITTFNNKVQVNFGNFATAATPNWNNFRYTALDEIGEATGTLIDDLGVNSGIVIQTVTPFLAEDASGVNTGNNSGIAPDMVLQSFYYIDPSNTARLKLKNLSFLQQYTIGFIASRAAGRGDRTTNYKVGAKSATFDCLNNSTFVPYLKDLVPDANGELLIEVTPVGAAIYGYLNGLYILSSTNPNPPAGRVASMSGQSFNEQTNIKVSPNPFTDYITITTTDEVVKASLVSSNGKAIEVKGESDGESYTIDLKNRELSSGLYLMNVTFKSGQNKTVKVIKK